MDHDDRDIYMKLVITGGRAKKSTDELNLSSLEWNKGPDLPFHIHHGTTVQYKDTFIIVGAGSHSHYFDHILQYDVDTKDWIIREEKLSRKGFGFTAFLIPDELAQCEY